MTLELKLRVPWRRDLLPVDYDNQDVIRVIKDSGRPNVCTLGSDVRVVDFFGECNRVPDVSRFHIGVYGRPYPHSDVPESQLHLQPQLRNIVLLVESPHKDEYQFANINYPIAAANGQTGRNINKYLSEVLLAIQRILTNAGLNEAEYIKRGSHVIISNPIQFQTSLNAIHKKSLRSEWRKLKDNVWKALWNEGEGGEGGEAVPRYIQLRFRVRLSTYRPSLIINACTGDLTDDDSLMAHVETFVRNEFQHVRRIGIGHPSNWHRTAGHRNPTLINA